MGRTSAFCRYTYKVSQKKKQAVECAKCRPRPSTSSSNAAHAQYTVSGGGINQVGGRITWCAKNSKRPEREWRGVKKKQRKERKKRKEGKKKSKVKKRKERKKKGNKMVSKYSKSENPIRLTNRYIGCICTCLHLTNLVHLSSRLPFTLNVSVDLAKNGGCHKHTEV
jgi:hypothetical protein